MIMAEVTGLHVPRWIANGEFAVQPYIVMEHIDGPTLQADGRLMQSAWALSPVGS